LPILNGIEMDYRIHHQDNYYTNSFLLEGIKLLNKEGITVESLIENFSTQLNRLRLEIDMYGLSQHPTNPSDHPLRVAAEYMLEEMLLPPFIPYKHGIPVHVPIDYAAKATLSEEDDFYPSYLDDTYNICSLTASSEEYSYAAYMLGFAHTLKIISSAEDDKILKLFEVNYYAADHVDHKIISDDLWRSILLKYPRILPNAPGHLVNKDLYQYIFSKNTRALASMTWMHEHDIYLKLQDVGFTHKEYLKIIETQTPVCGLFAHRLSDEEFSNLLDLNGEINFSDLSLFSRSFEVSLKVLRLAGDEKVNRSQAVQGMNFEVIKRLVEMSEIGHNEIPFNMRPAFDFEYEDQFDDLIPF
jgi:hypothetical protein